jgi:diguanylate cyclase (GGDEF)-like protein
VRSNSIVESATANARGAVLAALAGAAAIVCAVLVERGISQSQNRTATERLVNAYRWSNEILLADERLTMSANMAAATGEQRWIDRYEANIPLIDAAIQNASKLAPPATADQLDAKTRLSNDRLVDLERASFDMARSSDPTGARAILDGAFYQYHKQILSDGTRTFVDELIASVNAEMAALEIKSLAAVLCVLPLAVAGGLILWRRLNASLEKSVGAHLEAERKLKSLAMNDVLTGLPNRNSLRETLQRAIQNAEQAKTKLAVLMIDLDRFKPINDRYGHLIGDLVLKEVAGRMAKVVRNGELRGRYGGDEFIALVEYATDDEIPRRVGRRLVEILSEPMTLDGLTLDIGASVGFAVYPTDATGDKELMRKADVALYNVKEGGRGDVRAYTSGMDTDIEARDANEQELRRAIRTGAITPYFQPLVDLSSGRICGFEVLSRWHHPIRGLVPPAEFIPLAEEAGLINDLTMAVLKKACLETRALPSNLSIAVNIAPRQIQDEWLVQKILTVLAKTKFPPQRLEIELTEYAHVDDIASAKKVIESLKSHGIKVALDDFGTGYSSLSYLSELPFDKIKIDRSFIRTLHDRIESAKIVGAIIGLGKSLGLPTIAEGVETERDAEALRAMGCTIAQGHLYSKPAPAADLLSIVSRLSGGRETRAVA